MESIHLFDSRLNRLVWIDYAKGIGIFLVVLGHVIRGLQNSSILVKSGWSSFLDHWIYSFHMPLFFFLSGIFVLRSLQRPFTKYILDKCYTLIYPYLIWTLLQSSIHLNMSKYTNHIIGINDVFSIFYKPIMQYWFLYVLFVIFLIFGVLYKLKLSVRSIFLFSIVFYLIPKIMPMGNWAVLYQTSAYMIYFSFGAVLSNWITRLIEKIGVPFLFIASLLGFTTLTICITNNINRFYLILPFCAMLGTLSLILISKILNKINRFSFLSYCGIYSLEIFVAHTIASSGFRIIFQNAFNIINPVFHLLGGVVAGIIFPLLLIQLLNRFDIHFLFNLRLNWKKG